MQWFLFKSSDPVLSDGRRVSEARASLLKVLLECNALIKTIETKLGVH